MTIGGEMQGGPGTSTFAPQRIIPVDKKFYIQVIQDNLWCIFEECSREGKVVDVLGGWLQGENTRQPTIAHSYFLYDNKKVDSLIIVGDKNGIIVGIYPNKKIEDLLFVLKVHSDLWSKK
jgi:hypothetical protein